MNRQTLARLLAARRERQAVAVITELASGAQRVVTAQDAAKEGALAPRLAEAFRFDQSFTLTDEATGQELFVNIHNPPLGLIIIGAVHIAQAIIPMARQSNYDVTVIDPRGAFATGARFPDVTLHAEWPDEILPGLTLDRRTALIALTHDPKIDDPALKAALRSELFYVGALGSRRTHATRLERLEADGFTEAELARIHAPIGLDIGARGAPEIAISVMAQIDSHAPQG